MKNIKIYILQLVLIGSFSACNSTKEKEVVKDVATEKGVISVSKEQFESSKMELVKLAKQEFSTSIKTNGFVDVPPANKAKVSAIIGGYIKNSPLLIGDKVKKGQLLLTIENPAFIDIQQEFLEVSEKLNYLKSEYERQKTLFNENITSKKKYLEAESNYKSTVAISRGLEQKLKLMRINITNVKSGNFTSIIPIYSPINGVVSKVNASKGKFVDATDVILEINNTKHKHLELVIFEKDVLNVKEKQSIKFSIPENSENTYNASVYLIGNEINEDTRTVRVHAHLEDENQPFLVGMFVEAEIMIEKSIKWALPIEAILHEDNKFFAFVLKNKTDKAFNFEKKEVILGVKNEEWIEVENYSQFNELEILGKGVFSPLENVE